MTFGKKGADFVKGGFMPHKSNQKDLSQDQILCSIARQAIAAYLKGEDVPQSLEGREFTDQAQGAAGVFVTLWDMSSGQEELRGCIGRHRRKFPRHIDEEISDCAILAATEDPRFPKLQLNELKNIKVEISLLGPLEPCEMKDLNPHRYGIVIESGYRGATLLPEIEGVDTVEKQVAITRRKAGIGPIDEIQISRFPVMKIREKR